MRGEKFGLPLINSNPREGLLKDIVARRFISLNGLDSVFAVAGRYQPERDVTANGSISVIGPNFSPIGAEG